MANVQYYDVILKPVITEKSMADMADKKYTFLVHTDANKTMIKEAVEKMFEGTKVAAEILKKIGYPEKDIELVKIAGFMHDIGNAVNRSHHAEYGA